MSLTTTLKINRADLVTINTALIIYNKEIKNITDYKEQVAYRNKISLVSYKVNKAFIRLDKQEVIE